MSMTNLKKESPPPQLPPSRQGTEVNGGLDSAWHNQKGTNGNTTNGFIKPDLGPSGSFQPTRQYSSSDRDSELSRVNSADRASIPDLQALLEYNKLQGERQMGQRALEKSSHAYDKHLLSRIGGPHTSPRSAGGMSPGGEETSTAQNTFQQLNGPLKSLAMPEPQRDSNEGRWLGSANTFSALSPRLNGVRSPTSDSGSEQMQRFGSLSTPTGFDGSARSHRESSDQALFGEQEYPADQGGMQDLNIQDRTAASLEDYQQNLRVGQKRRAVSPPSESVLDPSLRGTNGWHRRTSQSAPGYNTTGGQFSAHQGQTPLPPSVSPNRNGSYAFNYAGMTSGYPQDHIPPSPYGPQDSLSIASQGPPSSYLNGNQGPATAQTPRAPPTRKTASGIQRAPGLWICECCPKKPRKFENEEDLHMHTMEKQYTCLYCHNRFKNKNEAERHQNSLHLRRHSWACSALGSYEAGFHPTPAISLTASLQQQQAAQAAQAVQQAQQAQSTGQPHSFRQQMPQDAALPTTTSTYTDTCGYCGAEFANPPDWNERIDHLNRVHKFGECNQSKKFYRADHFRQHLKHSHAGTSGKWTNMLENACMKDEPPPVPLALQTVQQAQAGGVPVGNMVGGSPAGNMGGSNGQLAAQAVQASSAAAGLAGNGLLGSVPVASMMPANGGHMGQVKVGDE